MRGARGNPCPYRNQSAFHGGARSLHALQWLPGEWRQEDEGTPVLLEPQFARSTASTKLIPAFRPPSRYKARHMEWVRLICNAKGFVACIKRGIQLGPI